MIVFPSWPVSKKLEIEENEIKDSEPSVNITPSFVTLDDGHGAIYISKKEIISSLDKSLYKNSIKTISEKFYENINPKVYKSIKNYHIEDKPF